MAKKKSKAGKKGDAPKMQEKERVTLEAIEAMSDSDDDIPEAQWNAKAKGLQQAIKEGKFDGILETLKMANTENASDEMEEAVLDSSSEGEDNAEQDEQSEHDGPDSAEEEELDEDDNEPEDQYQEESDKEVSQIEDAEEEDVESEDESDDESISKQDKMASNNKSNSKALVVVTAELVNSHASFPWAETFDIVPATPLPFTAGGSDPDSNPLDIHDDLKREVAFYNSALEAVHAARTKCKEENIPFQRPEDFFAEMVKTDDHMAKVKEKLIFETKKMEAVAQRKSNREQKLRAKESQANRLAEKAKRKRDHFEQVQQWADEAARNRGGALDDGADEQFFKGPNKKRQAANRRYGFGGKNGRFKQNSRASMNDTSGFNPRGNFGGMGTKKSAKSKNGTGASRQGKRARDAGRSRRA